MRIFKLVTIIGSLTFGIFSCGGNCRSSDPSCQGEAVAKITVSPSSTVNSGQEVVFNATGSVFDKISWFVNGETISKCSGEEFCRWTFDEAGTYLVTLEVSVKASTGTTLSGGGESKDRASLEMTVQ